METHKSAVCSQTDVLTTYRFQGPKVVHLSSGHKSCFGAKAAIAKISCKMEATTIVTDSNEQFRREMQCSNCSNVFDSSPIYQCKEGHLVCNECHPTLTSCGVCQTTPIGTIRCLMAEKFITEFPLRCKYHVNGCNSQDILRNIALHENDCIYRKISCSELGFQFDEQCNEQIVLKDAISHLWDKHQNFRSVFRCYDRHDIKYKLKLKVFDENGHMIRNKKNATKCIMERNEYPLPNRRSNAFLLILEFHQDGALSGSIQYIGSRYFGNCGYSYDFDVTKEFKYVINLQSPDTNKVMRCYCIIKHEPYALTLQFRYLTFENRLLQ